MILPFFFFFLNGIIQESDQEKVQGTYHMRTVSVSDYNTMLKTIFLLGSFREYLFYVSGCLSLNENIQDFGLETVQEASLRVYCLYWILHPKPIYNYFYLQENAFR